MTVRTTVELPTSTFATPWGAVRAHVLCALEIDGALVPDVDTMISNRNIISSDHKLRVEYLDADAGSAGPVTEIPAGIS